MSKAKLYGGLVPLLSAESELITQFRWICGDICDNVRVSGTPKLELLPVVWEEWRREYLHFILRHPIAKPDPSKERLARLPIALGKMIECLCSRRIVTFAAKDETVHDFRSQIALDYPDEIAALSLAAAIYSSEIARKNKEEPDCALDPTLLKKAAMAIRSCPADGVKFRRLLKLRSVDKVAFKL